MFRHLEHMFQQQPSKSRGLADIPQFLRPVSGSVSYYIIKKIVQQNELSVEAKQSERCKWKVRAHNQRFVCNDIEWVHLRVLRFDQATVPEPHVCGARRARLHLASTTLSLDHTAVLSPVLVTSVATIRRAISAVQMSRASGTDGVVSVGLGKATQGRNETTDGSNKATYSSPMELSAVDFAREDSDGVQIAAASGETQSAESNAQSRRRVHFVRLKRREHADLVVLLSAEKYRYAERMLQPLMQRLANPSTARFWGELRKWEGVGASLLAAPWMWLKLRVVTTTQTKEKSYSRYLSYASASQVSLPDPDISERSQQIIGASEKAEDQHSEQLDTVESRGSTTATARSARCALVGDQVPDDDADRPEPAPEDARTVPDGGDD
ncbi:hypothetical protein PybrP1_005504 [[Pythium] brassicae (nom. inval.)]|nr:hypothetical protein PybrP1_005504 [[Pythium] brassicae (nom. inval.)]